MKIQQLKQAIESNLNIPSFMVWKLTDESSYFIARQYIMRLSQCKGLEVKYITEAKQAAGESAFGESEYLYILKTDKLETELKYDNLIVICNKTNYGEAITIPKLEAWLFEDYLLYKLPGMEKADIKWLMTQYETTDSRVTKLNFDRLNNDLDKVAIFSSSVQSSVFNELYTAGEYSTVSNLTIFDLTNALIHRDTKTVVEVLKVVDYIDAQPHVWLLSILLSSFRNLLAVTAQPNITAEELGISDKQLYVIKKYNTGYYTIKRLVEIYLMLTECEYMYKFGGLLQDNLQSYIICKILEG